MSAQRSNLRLRNQVHQHLSALLEPGGPLAVAPKQVQALLTDPFVQAEIARQYRASQPPGELDGHAVVITAGPPGAGKSSALAPFHPGYRRIDPDDVKTLLLERAEAEGLLGDRLGHTLPDGQPVLPGELAGWVHTTSTDVADLVRIECFARAENVIVEGTLAWGGLLAQYPAELADYDYEQLTVLDVEVPRAVAVEQARERWWSGRNDGSAVGGRFVADTAFDRFYPDSDAVSVCALRARELYDAARDVGVETRLAVVSQDDRGGRRDALISDAGVQPWSTATLGAVCIRCGRPLTAPESIARGMGDGCARLVV